VNKRVVHMTEGLIRKGFEYSNPKEVYAALAERIVALKDSLGKDIPENWLGDFPVPWP
jgi:hypothetical protein